MLDFLKKRRKDTKKAANKIFDSIKQISTLSDEINKKQKILENKEYELILDKKDEMFISLNDFLEFTENSDVSLSDIILRFKHVSELAEGASIVEMFSIVEDDHIVLCRDVETCEKHKGYAGNKIRIATVRRVK